MRDLRETLPRALAGFRRKCRHCGAATSDLRDDRVGFTCCADAELAQIAWRTDELTALRRQAKLEQANVEELEAAAREASGYKVDEAKARAERSRRGFEKRIREHYEPLANELKAEIRRYVEAGERRTGERRDGDRRDHERRGS